MKAKKKIFVVIAFIYLAIILFFLANDDVFEQGLSQVMSNNIFGYFLKRLGNIVIFQEVPECKCFGTETEKSVKGTPLKDLLDTVDPHENHTIAALVEKRHPNIGVDLLNGSNPRCDLIPYFTKFQWDGVWQTVDLTDETGYTKLQLYSASCDREASGYCDAVRVLGLSNRRSPPLPFCYLWKDLSEDPLIVQASNIEYIASNDVKNKSMAVIVKCSLTHLLKLKAVSLSYKSCEEVSNVLEIGADEDAFAGDLSIGKYYSDRRLDSSKRSLNYDVAICLPALYYYYHDISIEMVEWFELLKAMRASKFLVYVYSVHPNVKKVLRYYEDSGMASITYFGNPTPYVNLQPLTSFWFGMELKEFWNIGQVHFSDCILRNRHKFSFIFHLDIDEMVFLGQHESLPALVEALSEQYNGQILNFGLTWNHFFRNLNPGPSVESLPSALVKMRLNLYNEECPFGNVSKCTKTKTIFDTRQTYASRSHISNSCFQGDCNRVLVDRNFAFVGHFKLDCPDPSLCPPGKLSENNFLLKFKDQVLPKVSEIIKKLELLQLDT